MPSWKEKLDLKLMAWHFKMQYKLDIDDIEKQIKKIIQKKRLIFLDNNRIKYIEKDGISKEYNPQEVVLHFIHVGKWRLRMTARGIDEGDILKSLYKMRDKYYKKEGK